MSNTLTNILEKILVRGMGVLRTRVVLARMVNRDSSIDAARKGSTVDIPYSTAQSVSSVTPAAVPPTPGDNTPGLEQVSLDQWNHTDFHLTSKEIGQINADETFVPSQVEESFKAMASDINQYLAALYPKIYGYTGTAGTTPFGAGVEVMSATEARRILNGQLCPRSRRVGYIDDNAEAAALNLDPFKNTSRSGDPNVVIEGEIGRKFGIDWFADDDVLTHTAGTVGADLTINGAHTTAVNDRTDTLSINSTAGGTLVAGDIITIAGDTQTYATTTLATLGAGVPGNVTVSPGLQVALSGAEAVTKKATHVVNLVFHPDCFALAMRTPDSGINALKEMMGEVRGNVIASRTIMDPVTGLVCRAEYIQEYKQYVWDLDWMYGASMIDGRKACRIAG